MNYKQIPVMGTNCYLVWDEFTKNAVCIDPGFAGRKIAIDIQKFGLTVLNFANSVNLGGGGNMGLWIV